jgi:hypothetical protein
MDNKKDHFTNQFVHHLISHNNLKGGHFNKILNLHKGNIHNIYNKIKNLENTNVDSHIPMTDHLELISGKIPGGSAAVGGSLHMAGSMHVGGSAAVGGSSPVAGGFGDMAKNFYHHVLKLPNRDWELFREGASQTLGANPSPMWNHIKIALTGIHPRSNQEAYENILRMPNTHAAARMIEAENGHQHNGPFVNAISDIHSKVKHGYSNQNLANESLNPQEQIKDMQGGSFHDLTKPIAVTIHSLKPKHTMEKIMNNTNNAIHSAVQDVMPHALQNVIKYTAGGRLDGGSIIKLINGDQEIKKYTKHFDNKEEGGRLISIS